MATAAIPPTEALRQAVTAYNEALRQAVTAYNDGKLFEAERLCQTIIAAEPDFFDGLRLLATVQIKLGSVNEALGSRERALTVTS
jgi:thioredoxin-like negative regulator of GroEL